MIRQDFEPEYFSPDRPPPHPLAESAVKLEAMVDLSSTTQTGRKSTVNLVRTSNPWTEADSAAGFVLRYLVPMRRILTEVVGSAEVADASLKLLLAHLVSVGFGDHKQGKLRDFLLRGVRSAVKTAVADMPEADRPTLNLDIATLESKTWLMFWREGLLERAWRALERIEHNDPEKPLYTVLFGTTGPQPKTPAELAATLTSETGQPLSEAAIGILLADARTMFAQLIADEVAESMHDPSNDDVKREIAQLGLGKAFSGITV